MQVTRNVLNVSDIFGRIKNNSLSVNSAYQRSPKLWPISSRSYFIDTILNGYPFPKITFRQIVDTDAIMTKHEIVDGQQRIGTIVDFLDNNLRLTSTSNSFQGLTFAELDNEDKERFLAYEISVDTIIRASDEEVLETFRRMNSYMLPLNKAELRYSQYQGCFKWLIANLTDRYAPFFQDAGILTLKDISRMKDAELLTECAQIILQGVVNKSDTALEGLYKKFDSSFEDEKLCNRRIIETIDYIKDELSVLFHKEGFTGYLFYSLFSALQYNKYGPANTIDAVEEVEPEGVFCHDPISAAQQILEMINEVDVRRQQRKDKEPVNNNTKYAEFAQACESSTHRQNQRSMRRLYFLRALQG